MSDEQVVLVDQSDNELGLMGKNQAHVGEGVLHRAISVWVVNSQGGVLVSKRSKEKMLWPGYWSNTVCSHPRKGETYVEAGKRRVEEELGFTCPLQCFYTFSYEAKYKDVGVEREMVGVLVGIYDPPSHNATEGRSGGVWPNPDEIADFCWIDWNSLIDWSEREREKFTPWFFLEKERLQKNKDFRQLVKV